METFEEYFEKNRLSNRVYNRILNDFMFPYDYCGKELECVKYLMVDSLLLNFIDSGKICNGIMIITPFQTISSFFEKKAIFHNQMFACYNKILYQAPFCIKNQNIYIRFYNQDDILRIVIEAPEVISFFQKCELERLNIEVKKVIEEMDVQILIGYCLNSMDNYSCVFNYEQSHFIYNYAEDVCNIDVLLKSYDDKKINNNIGFDNGYFIDDYLIGKSLECDIPTVEESLLGYFKYILNYDFERGDIADVLKDEFNKYKNFFETDYIINDLVNYLEDKDVNLPYMINNLEAKCINKVNIII